MQESICSLNFWFFSGIEYGMQASAGSNKHKVLTEIEASCVKNGSCSLYYKLQQSHLASSGTLLQKGIIKFPQGF